MTNSKSKNIPLTTVALLSLALCAFTTLRANSSERAAPPTTSVAVVDWLTMTDQLDEWKDATMKLKDEETAIRGELEALETNIKNKQEELGVLLEGSPQHTEMREEIAGMIQQLQFKAQREAEKLDMKQLDAQLQLYIKIEAAVSHIAEQEGWHIVIWKDDASKKVDTSTPQLAQQSATLISTRHLFYASENVDITNAVTQYMNNQFSIGNAEKKP